jgi:hypothetical protein
MAKVEKADMAEDIRGQRAEGVDHPEPSAAIPMPGVLGGDSSSSKDMGNAGCGGALPSDDAEARNRSRHHPVDTIVLEVSKDEAESQLPPHSGAFRCDRRHRVPQVTDTGADVYHLHLSELSSVFGDSVFEFCMYSIFL